MHVFSVGAPQLIAAQRTLLSCCCAAVTLLITAGLACCLAPSETMQVLLICLLAQAWKAAGTLDMVWLCIFAVEAYACAYVRVLLHGVCSSGRPPCNRLLRITY